MPEYILDKSGVVSMEFCELDSFTQGYIEAMFFTSECPQVDSEEFATLEMQEAIAEGAQDGVLPCDTGFADLSVVALGRIIEDCRTFQLRNADLLQSAYVIGNYDSRQAGRDFWYTRNGHGVGFWDRDLGDVGDKLTEACRSWREVNPWYCLETGKVGLE